MGRLTPQERVLIVSVIAIATIGLCVKSCRESQVEVGGAPGASAEAE